MRRSGRRGSPHGRVGAAPPAREAPVLGEPEPRPSRRQALRHALDARAVRQDLPVPERRLRRPPVALGALGPREVDVHRVDQKPEGGAPAAPGPGPPGDERPCREAAQGVAHRARARIPDRAELAHRDGDRRRGAVERPVPGPKPAHQIQVATQEDLRLRPYPAVQQLASPLAPVGRKRSAT